MARKEKYKETEKSGERKTYDMLLALFKRLDKDKDGRLEMKEMNRLARRLDIPQKRLLQLVDQNKDGKVDFNEFSRFFRKRFSEMN